MEFYIQWCGALQWTHWCSYLKQLICSCLASYFSGKATKVGSPPDFPKLIYQFWEIPQPQYFITLSLDPHWTYFWKHYIYLKQDTKFGSQNFGYQIWFCTRLLRVNPSSLNNRIIMITRQYGSGYFTATSHYLDLWQRMVSLGHKELLITNTDQTSLFGSSGESWWYYKYNVPWYQEIRQVWPHESRTLVCLMTIQMRILQIILW